MESVFQTILSAEFGYSVLRVTTPILFSALAALITNKAGVMNIALEGIMLFAALFGVIGSAYSQSIIVGLICAIAAGVAVALILAYFALQLKANLVLTGIALNLFASGGTVFILYLVCNDKGISASLKSLVVPKVEIPIIKSIPILGHIFSGHSLLTYLSLICVLLVYILVYKTAIGLRIRAVGENPNAAESVGINVIKIKFIALMISGVLAALGGAYMSMGYVSWFSRDMVAGRGFIGLAAQNLGGAEPIPTLLAALAFGIADAMSNILQSLRVPAEFVQVIPYVTTLIGLVLYSVSKNKKNKKELV